MKTLRYVPLVAGLALLPGMKTPVTNPPTAMNTTVQAYLDRQDVIATANAVFTTSDRREWDACARLFTEEVILDYQSLSGQPAESLSPQKITERWRGVLPGFGFTQHMLTNHEVEFPSANLAVCRFYGHAVHYIPQAKGGEEWGVYGTYRMELIRRKEGWQVRYMQYNHKYQHGNPGLPALAIQRAKAALVEK
jgi:hypothetical protein